MTYEYDEQNQLTKETYYDGDGNEDTNITDVYSYTYDTAGNILTEALNGTVTKTYTYGDTDGWNDLLTAVDGATITYDASGNPIFYENGFLDYAYMEWENGRQLSFMDFADGVNQYRTIYTYDADGIRCQKIVENTTHNYITQNGKVVRETIGSGTSATVLDFVYDASGRPFALIYDANNTDPNIYYYILNLQGDVVGLIDDTGSFVAEYTYDAWGKVLTATGEKAEINPLRYRGYYYDSETGFYYLQSRYYDPELHRFINADSYASTGQGFVGTNMFAYCLNNPVCYTDETGHAAGMLGNIYYSSDSINDDDAVRRARARNTLNGQGIGTLAGIQFGDYTLSHNGCEVIATYNALLLTETFDDLRVTLDMIIKFYGDLPRNFCGCYFGVFPDEIGPCLEANGKKYIGTSSYEEFMSHIEAGYVGIMTKWNDPVTKGIHTVAICGYSDGTFDVFNAYNNAPAPKHWNRSQVDNYTNEEGTFWYGYIIIP